MVNETSNPVPDIRSLRRIEVICSKFENAQCEDERDIEKLVVQSQGDERELLMRELILLDIELRSQRQTTVKLQDYQRLAETYSQSPDELLKSAADAISKAVVRTDRIGSPPVSQRYDFQRPLGCGGVGVVWHVFDRVSERPLAIKVLRQPYRDDEAANARLEFEGLLTGTLQHPGIPPVFERGKLDDGTRFFSLKLIEGESFEQILQTSGEESLDSNLAVFQRIAQTLAYGHAQGVIHRDIKPQNVMVGRFGEVQVMDWGLAKRYDEHVTVGESQRETSHNTDRITTRNCVSGTREASGLSSLSDLTTVGDVVGTPGYMAPEQARGELETLGPQTDVFGLGAILYQILLSEHLFVGHSRSKVVEATKLGDFHAAIRKLDDCDQADWAELCKACLQRNPDDRPTDAGVVATEAAQITMNLRQRAHEAEIESSRLAVQRREERRRHLAVTGLVSTLAVVFLASGLVVWSQWQETKELARSESAARAEAETEAATTQEINDILKKILASPMPDHRGHDVSFQEVLDDAVDSLENKLQQKPEVEASIRLTLGEGYRWLSDYRKSEEQLSKSVAAYEASGNDEPGLLRAKDRLAGVLRSMGRPKQLVRAAVLRQDVLKRRRESLGNNDLETVNAMNNLGMVYLEQQKLDEAKALFTEAVKTVSSTPSLEMVETLPMQINLADIMRQQGDFDEAEEFYRRVIDSNRISTYSYGNALVQLGEMLHWSGRNEDAVIELTKAMESRREYLGAESELTLSAMRKLARAIAATDDPKRLLAHVDDALEKHLAVHGPGSSAILEMRMLRTDALLGLDRQEDAVRYTKETIDWFRKHRDDKPAYAEKAEKRLNEIVE